MLSEVLGQIIESTTTIVGKALTENATAIAEKMINKVFNK